MIRHTAICATLLSCFAVHVSVDERFFMLGKSRCVVVSFLEQSHDTANVARGVKELDGGWVGVCLA